MDDGLVEALFRPGRSVRIRGNPARDYKLLGLDAVSVFDVQSPHLAIDLFDVGDGSIESDSSYKVIVLGKVVQVTMNSISGDVTVRSQTLLFHGIEGIFEEAMANLSEEVGVNAFFVPDTTYGAAVVENQELRMRSKSNIRRCSYQTIPACCVILDKSCHVLCGYFSPAPMMTTSNCSSLDMVDADKPVDHKGSG